MAIKHSLPASTIKEMIKNSIDTVETMFVGYITSVDAVNQRYSVQPILDDYDEVEKKSVKSAVLFNCPMMSSKCGGFVIRMPYEVGDTVYVGVSKKSVDEALSGKGNTQNRMAGVSNFRQVDGVILGGLLTSSEGGLSSDNTSDLLMLNRNTGDKITMLAGGGVEIEVNTDIRIKGSNLNMEFDSVNISSPETTITGNLSVQGSLVANGINSTKSGISLDTHTHEYIPGDKPKTNTSVGKG